MIGFFLLAIAGAPVAALADPVLQGQAPCNEGSAIACLYFTAATIPSFTVRSIAFNAPASGTALVLFQATLYCAHNTNSRETVDIDTELVDSDSAVAARDQPGGARYYFKLQGGETSATINVNASRAFAAQTAGPHQYNFAVHTSQLDAGVTCYFYNDSHSVTFVPG